MNSPGCDHDGQNTNSVYGKLAALKITNVLYSNKYCCMCLETCDGLLGLDTCGVVDGGEKNLMILTLREMLEAIFDDTVLNILRDSSNHICPACTDSIQKTLSFIQKTKTHALIFAKYITTLNRLSENLLQLGDTENLFTVVLNASLDKPKDTNRVNKAQSEGAKRKKEDESPRVRKKAKVTDGREKKIETVDIEREERDMGVGVNTEGSELVGNDEAPCNNEKGKEEIAQISEPTAPVTKECCPVCKKRPCVHENYLAAFEKRLRNRVIECPKCEEILYTLTDLIKHVNMEHFKSKPTIRDICIKIFQSDLVMKIREMKDQAHPNIETQESDNSDQFVGEIVNEEPPIEAKIIVQEETQENNEEEIQHDEDNLPMDTETRNVHSGTQDKVIETVDIEREERDMGVGVNTEGSELVGNDEAPCNNEKGKEEIAQISEPTAPVTKECCPVCKKRPCVHENYLAAFEKRQRNRVIECPKCEEILYTLTDLIKHVNMEHFKSKPTIRDICIKIFQSDLVMKIREMKDQAHPNIETQESDNSDQFVGEIVNEEPPIEAEIIVQEETQENNEEEIQHDEENLPMDTETRNVHSGTQDKVAMSDLIIKRTKILHLKQGLEECVLNSAVLPIKDTDTTQEQTYSNIESNSTDTEQIIQEVKVNSSDEQPTDKNVIEQTLNTKTDVHIDSEPKQCDTSNNLVESNLIEKGKILHLKPDLTGIPDFQKKVLIGILKKGNTSKNQRKSVRFGDCPTLSDWRKEFISGNTDFNENAKFDAETKTSEEAKENEIISVNEDDVNNKRKDADTFNSKSSSSPLVRKGLFNIPIRRDFSIVLIDIFKNRNLTSSQMPISVYDDRYKNIITNLNKYKTVGSKHQKPVYPATENVVVNEMSVINETDIHKALENTELKVILQTDLLKTNQEPSLTCKEKPISGIFESSKVSRKKSSKKKELPEVGVRPTDTLQSDGVLNQNPEISQNVQKEVDDITQVKTVNPEPLKCTQAQIDNTPPNKKDTMNPQKIIHHKSANNALKSGCNAVLKEGLVTKEKNENYEAEQLNSPKVCVSKNNDLNTQTDTSLITAQAIVENTKGQSRCKETNDKNIIRPNDAHVFNMERKSPTKKDSRNEHGLILGQTNIVLKTAQVIVEKIEGYLPRKENTEKRINILSDEKVFLNIERSPQKQDSTKQTLIHADTTELKATQKIDSKSKSQSSCLVAYWPYPNNQRIKTYARKQLPYKNVCKNTYNIIRELKKGEIITVTPNNMEVSPNKKGSFAQNAINESTKTQLKLAQESVGTVGQSTCIEEGEISALRPNEKMYNIERTLLGPPNMKPICNTQNIIQEQTITDINQQDEQTNNQELVKISIGQSTCIEGQISIVKPNHDKVPKLYKKVHADKMDAINKNSLIHGKTDSELTFSQELVVQTKVQLPCLEEGEIITVRPNYNKLFNLENKTPPNEKDYEKTFNVIRKLEKGEIITVTPNNEQVYNIDRTLFESSNKNDSTKTQWVIPTNNEVEKIKEVSIHQQNRKNNTVKTNREKVNKMERKFLTHSGASKKIRGEVKKKRIVGSLQKKNEIKNRLSPKAVQYNPIRKGPNTIVHKQQKVMEESDGTTEEIKEPQFITEIIEEENIIEKNEKHALTYEKQRRGRTFECPECKKMLYSLKDLIAHVNKNNCKKIHKSMEAQGGSSKDNIQRLKSVKIPTMINKKASAVPTTSKRKATSLVAGEEQKITIKEHLNNKAASKKKSQKETDAICTKCNVLACKHDRYRQVYDKLRKNKACECPECKQMMLSLSGFIAHVNKSHVESKIVLRDIYYNDFPSTFVQTHEKSEQIDSPPKKNVSRDTEVETNAKCTGNLETETPTDEFEVEFLEDQDELEEIQESHEANVSLKEDKTTENKPSEHLKCKKCQIICPDEEAYTQHRQEHELIKDLYKEVTAELQLEDRMENETETEGNERSHKCGTCGLICKSRTQLTLHLKSTGHILKGTISCPKCMKRPCRHEKYLYAYKTQKTTGKIECFECKKTQISLDALIAHVNTEHLSIKSIKCDGCNQMVRGNLFKKHNKKCQKALVHPVKCTKCPALFVNEEAYMVHNLEHELLELNEVSAKNDAKGPREPEHSEIIDNEKIYECGTCGKIFRHRSWLKLHLKATDHVVKKNLSCPQCSKRPCKHEEYLLVFENQNEKNKPKCQQCKDSLDSLSNYIAHVNKDHLKNKAIKCECCKEEFYIKSQLITHLKVHEPKLTCEHCFCEFRRSLFRKHKIKCQNAKKRVKCAKCPTEKAYKLHKQDHPQLLKNTGTTSVERLVQSKERRQKKDPSEKRSCNNCNKMISREAMALHMRIHSRDCPYPCHGCSMRFKRSSERAMHVLKVHSRR